jgi:type II secretion system protein I
MTAGRRQSRFARRRSSRRGFTLLEVLFTLMILGLMLPSAMRIVSMTSTGTNLARHRSEASALAESKLTELVGTGQWQNGASSGDFSADGWPTYAWTADVVNWDQAENMQQLRVTVTWTDPERGEDSVYVDTLVYLSNAAASAQSGGTTGGTTP